MLSAIHTVLVVDDDALIRQLMARTLSEEGYDVQLASNGEEALVLARRLAGELALVVTDLQMPKMGGTQLAAHLARLIPAPQVLFISGSAGTAGGELPGPLLPKPFTPGDLVNRVHRMLDAPG